MNQRGMGLVECLVACALLVSGATALIAHLAKSSAQVQRAATLYSQRNVSVPVAVSAPPLTELVVLAEHYPAALTQAYAQHAQQNSAASTVPLPLTSQALRPSL